MSAGLAARTWADFRSHWRAPLALHLLMQLLGVAVFTPIVSWIGRRIVLASGELMTTAPSTATRNFGPDLTGLFTGDCGVLCMKAAIRLPLIAARYT